MLMDDFKNLTFNYIKNNIEALKFEYEGLLLPLFLINEVRGLKQHIYSLNIEQWKKDKIWEYLNGDLDIETIQKLL